MSLISRRTKVVTLFQGDDRAAIYSAADAALKAKARLTQIRREESAGGSPLRGVDAVTTSPRIAEAEAEVGRLETERDAVIDEAKPRAVDITLTAMRRLDFRTLRDQHQPLRADNEEDEQVGANLTTFAEPLIAACITSPVMSDGERLDFLADLSEADFNTLSTEAVFLNLVTGTDPKDLRAFAPTTPSTATP